MISLMRAAYIRKKGAQAQAKAYDSTCNPQPRDFLLSNHISLVVILRTR